MRAAAIFMAGLAMVHMATAQTNDFLTPIEPTFDFEPIRLDPLPASRLPDLGGRIIPPPDYGATTESFLLAGWPESIASLRTSFHPTSPWYQAVLEYGQAYGAREFLDHHYAALDRLSATMVANGDGPFSSNLLAEYQYFTSLIEQIPRSVGGVVVADGIVPYSEAEARTLFSIRLFDSLPAPAQPGFGQLTLTHDATPLPNGSALDTPMSTAERADTEPYRRVTFTARQATEIPVSAVRFAVSADHPVTVLSPRAVCSGAAPLLCDVAGPGPFALELELLPPDLPETPDIHAHEVAVTAQVFVDGGWQDAASATWGRDFRRCDAIFVERINAHQRPPVDTGGLLARLTALTEPNLDLPSDRLFPGPTRTALPRGEETRDIPTHSEAMALATEVDMLVRNRGLDSYLEGGAAATEGLNRAIGAVQIYEAMLQCDRTGTRDLYDRLEVELETVRRHLDRYKTRAGYAGLGRAQWVARVEAQRLVIAGQADTIGTPENAFADFISGNALSAFSGLLASAYTSAEVAARLGAANNIIGQAGAYLQIIQSLREYDTLLDWEATINEATAFMEAEAYMSGMMRTYEEVAEHLTFLLRTMRETEAGACTCYLSQDRYE